MMCRKYILLKHNKRLKNNHPAQRGDFDFDSIISERLKIYTFSPLNDFLQQKEKQTIIIDATTRFTDNDNSDVAIVDFQSSSPLYANIIWDLAHQLQIGNRIFVIEKNSHGCILDAEYYSDSFELIENNNNYKTYQKKSHLKIEKNRGLTSWSFCIPVGPEEPTALNCCVKRILELNIDDLEIILCGRPHENFRYFDNVKIVGEDIPAPPVHITKKKNELVKSATKDNVCILHDRVLLPSDFIQAVNNFGDMFPFVGFQSIYFADYHNLIPRRYSDFNVLHKKFNTYQRGDTVDKTELSYAFSKYGCSYQHCQQSDFGLQYLTGSLYICKRALWEYCPQNESYYWDEFEDVEFGLRASKKGIPSIINPYAFTQSINARSIIHFYGSIQAKTICGKVKSARSITEIIPFLRRKPIFRVTDDIARRKFFDFAKKYNVGDDVIRKINTIPLSGNNRYKLIFDIVMKSEIKNWQADLYVNDFFKMLLHEDINISFKTKIIESFKKTSGSYNKKMTLLRHPFLLNQVSNSFSQNAYMKKADDLLVYRKEISNLNSYLTAFGIKYFSKTFYFKLSVAQISKMITDTTPSRD